VRAGRPSPQGRFDDQRELGAVVTIEVGIGHNLPQEAPEAFAQAVIDVGHL
jgi:pimeloyl-ACP methyl ester carboxylesterase